MEYPITEQTYILNTTLSASDLNAEIDKRLARLSALAELAASIDLDQVSGRHHHYYWKTVSDLLDEVEELRGQIRQKEDYELLKQVLGLQKLGGNS